MHCLSWVVVLAITSQTFGSYVRFASLEDTVCVEDKADCSPPTEKGSQQSKSAEPLEKRVYCRTYGPFGRCLQPGDKEKKDNVGGYPHLLPPYIGRDLEQHKSLEERNHVCKAYNTGGECLRYGFEKEGRN